MTALHWSVNGTRPEQPDFDRRLRSILAEAYRSPVPTSEGGATHSYAVLPRFWRGYQDDRASLETGQISVARRRSGQRWHYETSATDETSGETTHLTFETWNDDLRTIADGWRVRTSNDSGDRYNGCDSIVVIEDGGAARRLMIETNGRRILLGELDPETPLTFSAALFDVVPTLGPRARESRARFALLDEGHRIAADCTLTPVGHVVLEPVGDLEGYCLFGRGHEPSYWWVDGNGVVAIVGSTFRTFVRARYQPESAR